LQIAVAQRHYQATMRSLLLHSCSRALIFDRGPYIITAKTLCGSGRYFCGGSGA